MLITPSSFRDRTCNRGCCRPGLSLSLSIRNRARPEVATVEVEQLGSCVLTRMRAARTRRMESMEKLNKRRFFRTLGVITACSWEQREFQKQHLGALFMVKSETVDVGQREEDDLCSGRDVDEAPAVCRN